MRKRDKLIRCPNCKGNNLEYDYFNDPPPYDDCGVCDGDGVVTLAKKMEYVRTFKKMTEFQRKILARDHLEYDDYEDLEVLISRYKNGCENNDMLK